MSMNALLWVYFGTFFSFAQHFEMGCQRGVGEIVRPLNFLTNSYVYGIVDGWRGRQQ